MLVLSRKETQSIKIGDSIFVTITKINGNRVQVGVQAPHEVKVFRTEMIETKDKEQES